MVLLALLGCAHVGYLDGAHVLDRGSSEYTFDLSYARDPNALSTVTGDALPSAGFHWRSGLAPNLDAGFHLYTFGIGGDIRLQVVDESGWAMAVQPQFDGFFIPLTGADFGVLDLTFPVRAEVPLSDRTSIFGGPAVLLRQGWFVTEASGLRTRSDAADVLVGGGAGVSLRFSALRLGLSGSVYGDLARATGVYGGISIHLTRVVVSAPSLPQGPRAE